MESSKDQMVKLPSFDGKRESFSLYWAKLRSYAKIKKCETGIGRIVKGVATKDPHLPTREDEVEALDPANETDKKKIRSASHNDIMMACYIMSFATAGLLRMIEKSKSEEWPSGQAWMVTKLLLKKYKPTDRISKSELDSDLMNLKLKVENDPATLFEAIAALEVQYEVELDLDRVVPIMMRVSPELYHPTLVTEQ